MVGQNTILIAPHNDDESLFAAYTLLRKKPLVVIATDSWVQWNRGDGIDYQERRSETKRALGILGCPMVFLGIRDDKLTRELLATGLGAFDPDIEVYAPALQGGHAHHDLVHEVCRELFRNISYYTTYTKHELWTTGEIEVVPTEAEKALKNKALSCYESQLRINRPHFDAVMNKSEWIIPSSPKST